ncbi:MAG TPA: response regulator [Hyphomicrobiaceae bacterium]|nr:response regulator [Hyphomicrobiaceae bacterium]
MNAHEPVNILLVDDQPAKLLSYEVILADLNENLIKANSAREALSYLLKTDVAVVLADVCMPDLDGFELARMLREHPRFEKTAIIFVSAIHLSDVDRIRGYETGGVDYVPVPVIPEILRAKVKIFTELYRKTRALETLNDELERRVRERTAEVEQSSARLRLSEERLRLASDAAGFGTYEYNGAAGPFYWSPHLRSMVGMPAEAELTLDIALDFVHADHRDAVRRHMLGDHAHTGPHEIEFKIVRADGEVRWLLDRGQTVDCDGGRARVIGTILDITDRKVAEERQRLLMAELDHRVKNILSNVGAIAHLSSHRATSVSAFVEALDGRIRAMSHAHTLLRRGTWDRANLADLAAEALSPFRSRTGSNIEISGSPVWIVPELTQSLALILHELATNAVKHGALSSESGRVKVSWTQSGDTRQQLKLVWEEQGGPAVSEPTTKGFGLTVLQAAAGDLGGVSACNFRPTGLTYTLQGPFAMQHPPGLAAYERDDQRQPEEEAMAPRTKGPSHRILVVEDEALVALQLQEDLENEGHQVIGPARNLEQGISLAVSENIDAALIDVSLGRDTSAPIADQLLARNIPFAFATGYADGSILPERLRAVPRLSKPYALNEVRRLLDSLVAGEARASAR